MNTVGNIQWQKSLGGTDMEHAVGVEQTAEGDYFVAGDASSTDGDVLNNRGYEDYWILQLSNDIKMCPAAVTKKVAAGVHSASNIYQWQIDTGAGFTNISNNTNYSGALSDTLTITNPLTSWYGYKYRCVIITGSVAVNGEPAKLKFGVTWTGVQNNLWNNPANWDCNVIPDANTDVVIPAGVSNYPVVNINTSVRSVTVSQGATISVLPGITLLLTGP